MADNERNIKILTQIANDDAASSHTENAIQSVANHLDLARQRVADLRAARQALAAEAGEHADAEVSAIERIVAAAEERKAQIDASTDAIKRETDAVAERTQRYKEFGEFQNSATAGYGVPGGFIGPRGADDPYPDEGGSSGGGNVLAIGRGARAAGGLARIAGAGEIAPAATAFADVLFVMKGVEEATDSLGISMSSLLTAAIPVVAAVAGIALAFAELQRHIKEGTDAVNKAVDANVEFNKLKITGTSENIRAAIGDKEVTRQANQETAAILVTNLKDSITQNLQSQGFGEEAITNSRRYVDEYWKALTEGNQQGASNALDRLELNTPQKVVADNIKKLGDASLEASVGINYAKLAMGEAGVKANDAAVAARELAAAQIGASAQYAADNKLTKDQVEDRKAALEANNLELKKSIEIIQLSSSGLNVNSDQYRQNEAAIKSYGETITKNAEELSYLNNIIGSTIRDLLKWNNDINAANAAAFQQRLGFLETENKLMQSGTPDQVDSTRLAIEGKLKRDQAELDNLAAQNSLTSQQVTLMEKLKAQITESQRQLEVIDTLVAPAVNARAALEDIGQALEDFGKKSKALEDNLRLQEEQARAREKQAEEQYTQGSIQDIQERGRIAQEEDRRELELAQQTADRIIDINENLANRQVDAYTNYGRQVYDDQVKGEARQAKLLRDAQQQQEDDNAQHLKKLAEIKKTSDADERIALQDREFGRFYQLQLKAREGADKENEDFVEREAKLQLHLKRQNDELAISMEAERKQRLLDYNRKLSDLALASQRDIEQTLANEDRKLQLLRDKEQQQLSDLTQLQNYKLELLRAGLLNEIELYNAQEQAKLQLLANTQAQIAGQAALAFAQAAAQSPLGQTVLGFANAFSGSGGGSGSTGGSGPEWFDGGGLFSAGQLFAKGNINEKFDIGGNAYTIPGAALVFPMQAGSATPQGGLKSGQQGVFAPQIILNGVDMNNTERISEYVLDKVYDAWEEWQK